MKPLRRSPETSNAYPVKILQFGFGNFLRGFSDWMVEVANQANLIQGTIAVVQIHSKTIDEQIINQDGLFHVVERGQYQGKLVDRSTLVTCISSVTSIFEDYEGYLKLGENPDLEFVISNTTEAGILFDPTDHTIEVISKTFPGKLCALLYHRFTHFKGSPESGLIFLPCELIEKNGQQLKECILAYARKWELPNSFDEWINTHNSFCDTLVDRIVPGFPKAERAEIELEINCSDELTVMVEPYHFWAIQGPDIIREKFPLDKVGLNVKFVPDLSPYRTMKVRILNGAHTTLVPYAYLHGFRTVRESVENPQIFDFLKKSIFEEIIPSMDYSLEELNVFADDVLERFANPFIRHELKSIALNSISKFRVRVLPSLIAFWKKNQTWPANLTMGFAALILFYKGENHGEQLPLNDDPSIIFVFAEAWKKPNLKDTLLEICGNPNLWGSDLSIYPELIEALESHLMSLLISTKS